MKQRLGLALALLGDTKLLILDEPFVGLDPIGIEKFRAFIHRLSKEKKVSILISSHQLSEIESLCERYLLIAERKLEMYSHIGSKTVEITVDSCTPNFIRQTREQQNVAIQDKIIQITCHKEESPDDIIRLIYQENMKILHISTAKSHIANLFSKGDV